MGQSKVNEVNGALGFSARNRKAHLSGPSGPGPRGQKDTSHVESLWEEVNIVIKPNSETQANHRVETCQNHLKPLTQILRLRFKTNCEYTKLSSQLATSGRGLARILHLFATRDWPSQKVQKLGKLFWLKQVQWGGGHQNRIQS